MPIPEGLAAVKGVMEKGGQEANIPVSLFPLKPEIWKRGRAFYDCTGTCKGSAGDTIGYHGGGPGRPGTGTVDGSHEIEVWHIGLMFVEYIAGLLLAKARDANCPSENKTNPRCLYSRLLFQRMLWQLKADLRNLLTEIEEMEKKDSSTWELADRHPTPP